LTKVYDSIHTFPKNASVFFFGTNMPLDNMSDHSNRTVLWKCCTVFRDRNLWM